MDLDGFKNHQFYYVKLIEVSEVVDLDGPRRNLRASRTISFIEVIEVVDLDGLPCVALLADGHLGAWWLLQAAGGSEAGGVYGRDLGS